MLAVRDITVTFGERTVLGGVSLDVGAGEVVALLGPSGSGKTTLLRVIAGIGRPDHGTVHVDGIDVSAMPVHLRNVGMVFQDLQLFPHRDVADNVGFGLKMARVDKPARTARVAELLQIVGLPGFERRSVTELSGGEARRVALARSLAPSPKVLLLDEPFTGLDTELHDRLVVDVGRILRGAGTTAVMVTHQRPEAERAADRVVLLDELRAPGSRQRDEPLVVAVEAAETHRLRRAVLRDGTPSAALQLDGDDERDTVHLAIRSADGATLVGTSTWLHRPFGGEPDLDAYQLRAMAVAPGARGSGYGAALLRAGLAHVGDRGGELVWAKARESAVGFYTRFGFQPAGETFVDAETGLPHRLMTYRMPR